MIPFAVSVEGVSRPGQAQWVLAVSRESLLVVHEDGTFHWHKLADCRFVKLISPDAPRPVVSVERPQLVRAGNGLLEGLRRDGS